MIVATDGLSVHEIQPAFLAGVNHQLAALVVENSRRDTQIEVAPRKPLGVGGPVVIGELKRLGVGILFQTNDAAAKGAV